MMRQVRQSFEELRVGDSIRVKNCEYPVEIVEKLPGNCLRVTELDHRIQGSVSYDQYDYTLIEEWVNGDKLRYLAIRLPLDKLRVDMVIAVCNRMSSYSILSVKGEEITLEDVVHEATFKIEYNTNYNYSLLRPDEAADLVDDPFEQLALRILAKDPQALDAARDVLKC